MVQTCMVARVRMPDSALQAAEAGGRQYQSCRNGLLMPQNVFEPLKCCTPGTGERARDAEVRETASALVSGGR
ncbi:hypothetical protein E5288_WYG005999 [Bos mutus]|uniref:Uncharacterized protein n=1 Tax=Bos mutus TaxID=72004 RepID=A0A6B0QWC1_9CETA|nr:hypothetical protein [Bos mutus]